VNKGERNDLRVLILPCHDLWEPWTGQAPADNEDRELMFRLMAEHGMTYRRMDLSAWPWNPLPRGHTLLRALDPLRVLKVLLLERRADVVLCFFESSAFLLLLLRRLFRFKGRVVVVDIGVADGWRLREFILGRVVPRADALLPLGRNQAIELVARWHPRGLVQAIPMAIDSDFFGLAPDQPEGPILAAGDDYSRDYATLIEAAEGITARVAIRTRLLGQAGVASPNVQVMHNFLSYVEFRDLIGSASIVVLPLHPTRHAGGVSVLVQAMAMGKAVVISDSPGIADYIRDGETCLVVPCHDPAALRAAVNRLLEDKPLRLRLGQAARAMMVEHYSLRAQAVLLEKLFRQVAGQTPDA
jgi:glycosyltransferase involved in cell wall biosynthesis